MSWYFKVLRKYAVFTGRASRKEYWMYVLFNTGIIVVMMWLDEVTGLTRRSTCGIGPFFAVYYLAVLIPTLAVNVRRLHDVGKSGRWLFFSFIPFVGIITLIFNILAGEDGPNEYGEDPRSLPESSR